MSKPANDYDQGRRHFGYVNHYRRRSYGGHDQASLLYITGTKQNGEAPGLADLTSYRQVLDLHTATLTTAWADSSRYRIRAFTSFATPQLFEMHFTCRLSRPEDALTVRLHFDTVWADNGNLRGFAEETPPVQLDFVQEGLTWRVRSTTNCRTTEMLIAVRNAPLVQEGSDLVLTLPSGQATLRLLIIGDELTGEAREELGAALPKASPQLFRAHKQAAQAFWEQSGNVVLPDRPWSKVWLRSKYYLAASVPPLPSHIMATTGLNSNVFRHGFPQDMYYVVENLPRLGLFDLARAQMPYWRDNLDAVRRYTRRLADRDGAFYPWIPPFEQWDEFEVEKPANKDSYEFHNSGYVAAMVWHYYLATQDIEYLRAHVCVLEEIARFYVDITELGSTGPARIRHPLLRSQDEASRYEGAKTNALCSVWSALYTFRAWREACRILDRDGGKLTEEVDAILAAGYDFSSLERPDGTLRTHAEDHRPLGQQKHPVQLNAIAYLPMRDFMDDYPPVRCSWERRYDLTLGARVPESRGWTLGEFALASARMRAPGELRHDLLMVQPARFADPLFIQFYESSCRVGWSHKKAYYFTTSGLYLQALTDAVVQCCRGTIDLFAALLPEWEDREICFNDIRVWGGVDVSGWWRKGEFEVTLSPMVDIRLPVRVSRDVKGIVVKHSDGTGFLLPGNREMPVQFRAGEQVTLTYP
jgi:hypothetical protein